MQNVNSIMHKTLQRVSIHILWWWVRKYREQYQGGTKAFVQDVNSIMHKTHRLDGWQGCAKRTTCEEDSCAVPKFKSRLLLSLCRMLMTFCTNNMVWSHVRFVLKVQWTKMKWWLFLSSNPERIVYFKLKIKTLNPKRRGIEGAAWTFLYYISKFYIYYMCRRFVLETFCAECQWDSAQNRSAEAPVWHPKP